MAIRNNLNDIVKVDIAISTPGSSDESFSNVLLVVEGPETGKKSTDNIGTKVVSISQASELVDYGFSTESQAYIMANVAFSQSPKPSLVYVIARQVASDESDPVTYEKISVTLDRAKEAGGWYGIALAMAALCCSPPESCEGKFLYFSSSPTIDNIDRTSERILLFGASITF